MLAPMDKINNNSINNISGDAAQQTVEFRVSCGHILTAPLSAVLGSPVLAMVWHHHHHHHQINSSSSSSAGFIVPLQVDDDMRTFQSLLSHLSGVPVDLTQHDYVDLITLFRCAHKYQNYVFAASVLRQLVHDTSASTVLHLYSVLSVLPELPPTADPTAPSAPPVVDLHDSDPEQAQFSSLLLKAFQMCLQMIDDQSGAVLSSDALFSLSGDQLLMLLRRDTLATSEQQVAAAALRWLRHCAVTCGVDRASRRALVLGSVRLLQLSARRLKQLQLEQLDILERSELEAVLEFIHHGVAQLPAQLLVYRHYWQTRRNKHSGGTGVTSCATTGAGALLRQMMARTRGPSLGPKESLKDAAQRHQQLQKKHQRADKIKMALATGASLIFD